MSTLKHNQYGFAHIVIILIFVVGVSITGAYLTVSSSAATKKSKKQTKIASKDLKIFKAATRQYFKDGESFKKAPCKPEKVKVVYYQGNKLSKNDGNSRAYAYAWLFGAYKKVPVNYVPDLHKNGADKYCKVYWNVDSAFTLTKNQQCMTFMHEYGHLLGRDHNNDITSVMYDGYARDGISPLQAQRKFSARADNVSAKSLCADWVFQNRRT